MHNACAWHIIRHVWYCYICTYVLMYACVYAGNISPQVNKDIRVQPIPPSTYNTATYTSALILHGILAVQYTHSPTLHITKPSKAQVLQRYKDTRPKCEPATEMKPLRCVYGVWSQRKHSILQMRGCHTYCTSHADADPMSKTHMHENNSICSPTTSDGQGRHMLYPVYTVTLWATVLYILYTSSDIMGYSTVHTVYIQWHYGLQYCTYCIHNLTYWNAVLQSYTHHSSQKFLVGTFSPSA